MEMISKPWLPVSVTGSKALEIAHEGVLTVNGRVVIPLWHKVRSVFDIVQALL